MDLTPERKGLLLAYCRLDGEELTEEEHGLLELFFHSAVDYVGIVEPTERGRRAKLDLVVNAMVLDAWDHRDMKEYTPTLPNPALRNLLNQLKLTEVGRT